MRQLVDAASKGGNYLLNVGPTAEGRIPQPSVDRLGDRTMDSGNGEAIYGTTPSPFTTPLAWGRATSKPGVVYLHVFDWPATGELRVPPFGRTVKSARLLANRGAQVPVSATAEGATLQLPVTARDSIASVVALELE